MGRDTPKTKKGKTESLIENRQEEEEPEKLEHEIALSLLEVLQSLTPVGFELFERYN